MGREISQTSARGGKWSRLSFPNEKPSQKDFCLWESALRRIVSAGGIQDRLGGFQHEEYKRWEWSFDVEYHQLLHHTRLGMEVFTKPEGRSTR